MRAAGIGTAPVSFGVFGPVTPDSLGIAPARLLEEMAAAGYTGSELGPPGFFGTPGQTAEAFAAAGLAVLGAYVPLHLSQPPEVMERDLAAMRVTLAELAESGAPGAVAILADEGDDDLVRAPFGRTEGLSAEAWQVAADRIGAARDLAAEYGLAVSFHPHYATYVQEWWEIDTLLERTDVPLCLDTGHFQLGGADPVTYLRRHAGRVNHVHVKDLREAVLHRAAAERDEDLESWWADLACPLGEGDVAVGAFLDALADVGYQGWLVVEQDRAPVTSATWASAVADQRHNHAWLSRELGSR